MTSLSRIINSSQLARLKKNAMRTGVWFKVLSRLDRALLDLTIIVTKNICSPQLSKSIQAIANKLDGLFESKLGKLASTIGYSLLTQISAIAEKWGNHSAKYWATDKSFAIFLATMFVNK